MGEFTRLTNLAVDMLTAKELFVEGAAIFKYDGGATYGAINGVLQLSKSADYTLAEAEHLRVAVLAEFTAAGQSLTLGIMDEQVMFVANIGGTNAFTLKGQSGDTGTSLAAGKVALVFGSETANATKIFVLN